MADSAIYKEIINDLEGFNKFYAQELELPVVEEKKDSKSNQHSSVLHQ